MTELSWACWNPKSKSNKNSIPLPVPKSLKPFGPHLALQVPLTGGSTLSLRSAQQLFQLCFFFFPELVKSRLICIDALASPCLPICSFTDFMKDMNCVGCQTFMTSSATFTMCLSQFELVYCSVSPCQERWRLFYGYTDDCLVLCAVSNAPSFAMQLPEIPFPGIPDGFPCCSHLAICCPNTTVTGLGFSGEMEWESPIFAFNDPFVSVCLQSHIFFHIL